MLVPLCEVIHDCLLLLHENDDAVLTFLNELVQHPSNHVIIQLVVDDEVLVAKSLYLQLLRALQQKGAEAFNEASGLLECQVLLDVDDVEHVDQHLDVDLAAVEDFLVLVEFEEDDEVEVVAELGVAEVPVLFGEAERKGGLARVLEEHRHVERFLLHRAQLLEAEFQDLLVEVVDALEVVGSDLDADEVLVLLDEVHEDGVVGLEAVVGECAEGDEGLAEDVGAGLIVGRGLPEAIGDVGLQLEAGVVVERPLDFEAVVVDPLVLLHLHYLQLLVVPDGGDPLEVSDELAVPDPVDVGDEVVELRDLVALVVQFDIVPDLVGDLLDELQEVVLHALQRALGHEAQLHLLREVDVPDHQLYVDAGELGVADRVAQEVLAVQVDALGDLALLLEDVEGLVEQQAVLRDLEGQDVALRVEGHLVHAVEDVLDVPADLAVVLPLTEVDQLLDRAQRVPREDVDPLMVVDLHVLELVLLQPVPELLDLEVSAAEAQQGLVLLVVAVQQGVLERVWQRGLGDQVDHLVEEKDLLVELL